MAENSRSWSYTPNYGSSMPNYIEDLSKRLKEQSIGLDNILGDSTSTARNLTNIGTGTSTSNAISNPGVFNFQDFMKTNDYNTVEYNPGTGNYIFSNTGADSGFGLNPGTLSLGLGALNWGTNLFLGLYGVNQAKKLAQQKLAIDRAQVDNSSTSYNNAHVSHGFNALALAGGRSVVGDAAADNQMGNTAKSQTRTVGGQQTYSYNPSTNKMTAN